MSMNLKDQPSAGTRAEPLEPGSYNARVVQVIGLGLQPQEYNGEPKEPRPMVSITYELSDEFLKDEDGEEIKDKPRWISESFALYNLGSEKAKSTLRYNALDPLSENDGDLLKIVGNPCVVTIVTNEKKGKIYNNVSAVSAMRAKVAENLPDLVNDPVVYDPYNHDEEVFKSLPDWIQEKIKSRLDKDSIDSEDKESWDN